MGNSDVKKTGEEALTTWEPHIVYVEGGNTFWLQHCIEKGNWGSLLKSACTGPDACAVYIGKSAGAIVAGALVETATWKVRTSRQLGYYVMFHSNAEFLICMRFLFLRCRAGMTLQ